ncbi:MAG: hypothetical protein ACLUOI_26260 [Eisenbergiella sp.]
MLKSGGAFARFANHPYKDKGREDIHEALQRIYAVYMPDSSVPEEYSDADAKRRAEIAYKYGFTDIVYKLYHYEQGHLPPMNILLFWVHILTI